MVMDVHYTYVYVEERRLRWTSGFENKSAFFQEIHSRQFPIVFILYLLLLFLFPDYFFFSLGEGHINDRRPFVCTGLCHCQGLCLNGRGSNLPCDDDDDDDLTYHLNIPDPCLFLPLQHQVQGDMIGWAGTGGCDLACNEGPCGSPHCCSRGRAAPLSSSPIGLT